MKLTVNGTERELPDGASVSALLTDLGLGAGWVVVERNGAALLRSELDVTALAGGDVVEIVRAVAGG